MPMYGPCEDVRKWTDGNLYDNVSAALDRGWERWYDTPFIVQREDGRIDLMYQRGRGFHGPKGKWLTLLSVNKEQVTLFAFPDEKYVTKLVNAVTRLLLPYQLEKSGANWWLVPPFVLNQDKKQQAGRLAYKFRDSISFPTSLLKPCEYTVADFKTFIKAQEGADGFRPMSGNYQSYGLKETTHTIDEWGLATFERPAQNDSQWVKERYDKAALNDSTRLEPNTIIASHMRHLCGPKRGKGTRRVRNVVVRAKDVSGVQHVYCGLCGAKPNREEMEQLKFAADLAGMGLDI
jgi:hypothetical protein